MKLMEAHHILWYISLLGQFETVEMVMETRNRKLMAKSPHTGTCMLIVEWPPLVL